jgi:hypothetical protein
MSRRAVLLLTLLTLVAGYLVGHKLSAPPAVLGAASPPLSAPPAEWVVHDLTASGTAAVATRPAGGAGVQHVVDCISATVVSAPGGVNAGVLETVELVDGSLGVLMSWELAVVNGADGCSGGTRVRSERGWLRQRAHDARVPGKYRISVREYDGPRRNLSDAAVRLGQGDPLRRAAYRSSML